MNLTFENLFSGGFMGKIILRSRKPIDFLVTNINKKQKRSCGIRGIPMEGKLTLTVLSLTEEKILGAYIVTYIYISVKLKCS